MAAASFADEKGGGATGTAHHDDKEQWFHGDRTAHDGGGGGGGEEVNAVKYQGWRAMPYVIGNETFEKLGTIGTSSNLLVYLTTVFHMGSVPAATLLNVWTGTTNLATLAGAFLCDAYFGRYKTLGFASVSSFLGMVFLTLTAAVGSLHPPSCVRTATNTCPGPTSWQSAFLLSGLGLLVVGAGGIRPCNLAFGADQFDPHTESGKRGINSFFNWYYFTFTVSMMVSATAIIYVQSSVSWSLGLAIPAGLMFLSCAFFFIGSRVYVKVKPEGSPFTGIARVVAATVRKRKVKVPHAKDDREEQGTTSGCYLYDPPLNSKLITKLHRTDQFRILDKAAIVTDPKTDLLPDGSPANPWALCSLQQVEAVKCILRVLPIWLSNTMYSIVNAQLTTYVVYQALQSDRRLGRRGFQIPAGSFIVFTMLTLTLWIPIYDRLIVPRLRKITGKEGGITLLQRIGVGIVLAVVAMLASVLVERRRRKAAPTAAPFPLGVAPSGGAVSEMSSLWLAPQLAIMGLSEGFTVIGQVEFYYKQFPENMRSVAGSSLFCATAVSHYVSGLMIMVINNVTSRGGRPSWVAGDLNQGKLDYYYLLTAGIAVLNFFYFVICASWYQYKGEGAGGDAAEGEVSMKGVKPASEVAMAEVNGNHKAGSAAGAGALPEP